MLEFITNIFNDAQSVVLDNHSLLIKRPENQYIQMSFGPPFLYPPWSWDRKPYFMGTYFEHLEKVKMIGSIKTWLYNEIGKYLYCNSTATLNVK